MTSSLIRQVWAANLEEEVQKIAHLLFFFPVIAMDKEFPGVIYRPSTGTAHQLDPFNHYQILKANVDALKVIQVGLTLSDARGNLADLGDGFSSIWEFNFGDFDVDRDLHAPESIQLLKQQGIDFNKNREKGICAARFGQLLLKYRIVYNFSMVIWVTFHSAYDFAYLIKILTQRELPSDLPAFLSLVEFFFGMRVYDMKHIVRYCDGLYGGLDRIAKTLQVDRVAGKSHQAGSDSLLTLQTFMKLKDRYFNGRIGFTAKERTSKSLSIIFSKDNLDSYGIMASIDKIMQELMADGRVSGLGILGRAPNGVHFLEVGKRFPGGLALLRVGCWQSMDGKGQDGACRFLVNDAITPLNSPRITCMGLTCCWKQEKLHNLQCGVRQFIHVSTDEVYCETKADAIVGTHEAAQLLPTNPYSATKVGAEMRS
ncbi:hypothetical protein HHK36_025966 [Tetracentron sinense]|uniref:poly(A)-specific ribonuclease n=1 Tax=Tetracentron sinense TaxID=13715 RepID=A0A834YMI9_TETSI|nr:hypothetical protein HHK36_025966 [Tetracentron sinense]